MARFIRDEKRTYPLVWLTIGGIFAGASAWAVYAELVTRVPWEKDQEAFFEMELQQSQQSLKRANALWTKEVEPTLKAKLDRKTELEKSQQSGAYAEAKARLNQLNVDFANAEMGKTFGGSDLDEAYYHREEAEYERDKVATEVRGMLRDVFATKGQAAAGEALGDAIFADPPLAPKPPEMSEKMFHLVSEIARKDAHLKQIGQAINELDHTLATLDAGLDKATKKKIHDGLVASERAEHEVGDHLKDEVKNQQRVDDALVAMTRIDGPAEPALTEKGAAKRADERTRERARVCQGKEDTRNCINWLKLEPVDVEIKSLDVEISKARRFVVDAELREGKAEAKARPKFNPTDVIHSIVGPFQIQQVVLNWMDADRDVDREQVDRCQTCHMGTAVGNYTDAAIPRQFRSHPFRTTLLGAHPVETFGCTACHQGEGRATDNLAHSGWHLEEEANGQERWHFAGDHHWEDPLLPVGKLHHIIVDEKNDELSVKINKGSWSKVTIEHRSPDAHDKDATVPADYHAEAAEAGGSAETKLSDEALFFGAIQAKVQAVVDADDDVKANWHAVVRKLENRVQIGLEQNEPTAIIPAKETPVFNVRFTKPGLAETLGFVGVAETVGRQPLLVASASPSEPVRGEGMPHFDAKGRYVPPRGGEGLQIPDEMRNRFIEGLPELEASCLRCHATDVDLKPRTSQAKYVMAKLEREKAEAWKAKDPAGYKKAHDGSDDLPAPAADPAEATNPVPTFTEGRALFRKLNCTGCHILDGYPWDRNSGPGLDNVTAKVTPEWILTWIRYPRGWRAKTRMPNLWPKPLDPASKRPFSEASPEYAKWKATMRDETVAIASYLVERSDNPSSRPGAAHSGDAQPLKAQVQGYADVPGATAEKGKVYFESFGCQGCHATSDADVPEPWKSRERDIAPTLANMAGKTTADWIAYWVENPSRYWHGTKMPNLRLSRVEAASVGKYVSSLATKPLEPAEVDKDDVALVSDPAKRSERVPCANAGGALLTRVECGEKLIGYYGCFGCHNITGYEKSSPIAPELGGFAKKDITTLDFGYAIPDHHLQTTETFATLKLDSPRIYRPRSHRAEDGRLRPLAARDPLAGRLPQGPHQRPPPQRVRARAARRVRRRPRGPADRRRLQLPRLPPHRGARRRHRRRALRAARRRRAGPRPLPQRRGDARAAGVALLLPPRPGRARHPPLAPPRVGLPGGVLPGRRARRQADAAHAHLQPQRGAGHRRGPLLRELGRAGVPVRGGPRQRPQRAAEDLRAHPHDVDRGGQLPLVSLRGRVPGRPRPVRARQAGAQPRQRGAPPAPRVGQGLAPAPAELAALHQDDRLLGHQRSPQGRGPLGDRAGSVHLQGPRVEAGAWPRRRDQRDAGGDGARLPLRPLPRRQVPRLARRRRRLPAGEEPVARAAQGGAGRRRARRGQQGQEGQGQEGQDRQGQGQEPAQDGSDPGPGAAVAVRVTPRDARERPATRHQPRMWRPSRSAGGPLRFVSCASLRAAVVKPSLRRGA